MSGAIHRRGRSELGRGCGCRFALLTPPKGCALLADRVSTATGSPLASTSTIIFTPFPAFVQPMPSPPPRALLKVPSTKHSYNRYAPRSSSMRPASRMMASKTPSRTQVCNQRCTVLLLPNSAGKSFHFAPLSSIQKMPRSAWRLSAGGRPPNGLRGGSGIRAASKSIISSVSCAMNIRPTSH